MASLVCPVERKLTTGFPELDSLIDSNPRGTILFVLQDQQSNFLWIGTWSARKLCSSYERALILINGDVHQ